MNTTARLIPVFGCTGDDRAHLYQAVMGNNAYSIRNLYARPNMTFTSFLAPSVDTCEEDMALFIEKPVHPATN